MGTVLLITEQSDLYRMYSLLYRKTSPASLETGDASLSRNPVCTQEQTGSRTYMSEKTAKRNKDNRSLHFHVANFFKFMATNLSFTQFVT